MKFLPAAVCALLLCGGLVPTPAMAADPEFPLTAAPVGPTSLKAIGWAKRKLVIFAPEGPTLGITGMKWNTMRKVLATPELAAGLVDRETIVILAVKDELELAPGIDYARVPADSISLARVACGIDRGPGAFVLIGKDGGIKETWRAPVEPEVIFAAIDAMAMRRSEVAEREKGRK